MTEQELYDLWAPENNHWSAWVKPVLFTQMEYAYPGPAAVIPGGIPWANAADLATQRLAVILDLPGEQAVALGLQLAGEGFRPIPLFNTSHGLNAVIPMQDTITALNRSSSVLGGLTIADDAPPVFLLDSRRMRERGEVLPGKYDNRWLVFPQDFPSASFLKSKNLNGVVLVQEHSLDPQDDLAHVLLRWQEESFPVLVATLDNILLPKAVQVSRPNRYRKLYYQFLAALGLRRSGVGGFGAIVPDPSQGGSGYG